MELSQIIDALCWKISYDVKIMDKTICDKWRAELSEKGYERHDINAAISMIKTMIIKNSLKKNYRSHSLCDTWNYGWFEDWGSAEYVQPNGCQCPQYKPTVNQFTTESFPIEKSLEDDFKRNMIKLEQEISPDWHPGSNNQVLDIIPVSYTHLTLPTKA